MSASIINRALDVNIWAAGIALSKFIITSVPDASCRTALVLEYTSSYPGIGPSNGRLLPDEPPIFTQAEIPSVSI